MEADGNDPVQRQTSFLINCLSYDCASCQELVKSELERLALLVNQRAAASEYSSDVSMSVSAYVERGRKRRIDAHVRTHVLSSDTAKRSRTKIGMRVFVPRSRQFAWESEHLRACLTAGSTQFLELHSASIAFDASRMSKPSEETIAFLFQDCSSRLSTWLPVQVHVGRNNEKIPLLGDVNSVVLEENPAWKSRGSKCVW
eukprot:6468979-Amphidinium_carterae.1